MRCGSTRGRREVVVDGRVIALTPKEFDLLPLLAGSPRQVFSRRQLLDLVWDSSPDYQDPATVTVHIGRLRQKLEVDPEHPRWIAHRLGRRLPVRAMMIDVLTDKPVQTILAIARDGGRRGLGGDGAAPSSRGERRRCATSCS